MSVSDQGRGFDPQALRETTGFGSLSIRECVELLSGRMQIRSHPGEGSTFAVEAIWSRVLGMIEAHRPI
jgi:signal transduction histidine kinase